MPSLLASAETKAAWWLDSRCCIANAERMFQTAINAVSVEFVKPCSTISLRKLSQSVKQAQKSNIIDSFL